ncbi:MAG: type VI secretion system tube protein Hcp [Parafilimonas sp.]
MRKFLFTMFACTGFLLLQSSLHAQKIYIKAIGTVGDGSTLFKGGSVVKGHENEIEAISYSETDSSCGYIAGGGGSCKTATGPWIFSMGTNPSLIDFKSYIYQGKKVGRVTITFTTTGGSPFTYYTVEMNNVFVKTVSESGAAGSGKPQFYIELDPITIEWTNIVQNQDGSSGKQTSFGWDRSKNTHL